ncbi:MAG: hypothetical protein IPO21_05225 [Bacteroidales bacterium]|nr:hypothetical protein [Bacteroidales bacterium]
MAKENAITYIVIIPLALYYFTTATTRKILFVVSPLLLATLLFLIIRFSVIGFTTSEEVRELLNNPFIGLSMQEKFGTIFYTLFLYVKLLFVPYPLTYDYYPYHIEIQNLFSVSSILAILFYVAMVYVFLKSLKNKNVYGFCALLYLVPLFIVSNIPFPVGTFMNERFVFMSSLGFSLLLPILFFKTIKNENSKLRKTILLPSLVVLLLFYSVITITRNKHWFNDFTLFTHDVTISGNSAKSTCSAGGKLLEYATKESDTLVKMEYLELSKKYLIQSTHNYSKILKTDIYTDAELLLAIVTLSLACTIQPCFTIKE